MSGKLLVFFIADLLRTFNDGRNRLALLLWIRVKSGRLVDALHRCTNNDQLSHPARSTYYGATHMYAQNGHDVHETKDYIMLLQV